MGKSGGDGSESQQVFALPDDLRLAPPSDALAFEQVHGHRELRLHEPREGVGVEDEEAGQPVTRTEA